MNRMTLVAMAISLLPTMTLADATLPLPHRATQGNAPAGRWSERCAERLERARDEAAKLYPPMAAATVESVALELSSSGDPSAQGAADIVQLTLRSKNGLRVWVAPGMQREPGIDPHRWHETHLMFNGLRDPFSPLNARSAGGLTGTIMGPDNEGFVGESGIVLVFVFETVKRAVDDCLAMGMRNYR